MIAPEALTEFIKTTLKLRKLDAGAAMGKVRGWDSLSHVRLMLALETEYGVQIPPETFGQLTSLTQIIAHLTERGASQSPS